MFSKAKSGNKSSDGNVQNGTLNEGSSPTAAMASSGGKRSSQVKPSGVPSLISSDVVMNGNINAAGEVQFDGILEGDIKAGSLIIGEKASVTGEVACDTVTVRGTVDGAIRAKSVSLASTARIRGDILHNSLSVETGAHFEGNCRHSDDPLSDSSANDFRRTPVSSPSPRPASTDSEASSDLSAAANSKTTDSPSFLNGNRSPLR